MGRVTKRERDFTSASLASVDGLLRAVPASDPLARLSLEGRRETLVADLEQAEFTPDHGAVASLYFGGSPVVGQFGIEAEFASKALGQFQELVTKLYADEHEGGLAQRGPVRGKSASRLHVTNIVRGSFGFALEEAEPAIVDTPLKTAVDHATELLTAFATAEDAAFEEALANVDDRTLATARSFFHLMAQEDATLRLVSGKVDVSLSREMVARATERAEASRLEDGIERIAGTLIGLLPASHNFEFRMTEGRVLSGKVVQRISTADLENLNRTSLYIGVVGMFRVKRLYRKGTLARETYSLEEIAGAGAAPALPVR